MEKNLESKIKLVFGAHPKAKEFHFTSDGQAFTQETFAKNHAKTLEDKAVTKITRAQYNAGNLALETDVVPEATNTTASGAKNDFQAKGAKGSSSEIGDEAREELVRKYEMLSGKKAGNMRADTLTQKVSELEAAAAQGQAGNADQGTNADGAGADGKGKESDGAGTDGDGGDGTDKSE